VVEMAKATTKANVPFARDAKCSRSMRGFEPESRIQDVVSISIAKSK